MGRDVTELAHGRRWPRAPEAAKHPEPDPAKLPTKPQPTKPDPAPSPKSVPAKLIDIDGDGIPDNNR
jgi:hypothetical protein